MERQFAAREFAEIGEILHVCGTQLWLSDVGVIGKSRAEVVDDCKKYVDDLYSQRKLAPLPVDIESPRTAAYGGLGFHESNTAEFQEIFGHLHDARLRALEDSYPEKVQALLSEMKSNPELFYRRLNVTASNEHTYYRLPILASIKPEEFVLSWLALRPSAQHTVMIALRSRYEGGRLDRDLQTERGWLVEVRKGLMKASNDMTPMSKFRVQMYVEQNIASALEPDAQAQ